MIRFPVNRFGFGPTPSLRDGAEAIHGATSPDDAEAWIATASPRNDSEHPKAIERLPDRERTEWVNRKPNDPASDSSPRATAWLMLADHDKR